MRAAGCAETITSIFVSIFGYHAERDGDTITFQRRAWHEIEEARAASRAGYDCFTALMPTLAIITLLAKPISPK